MATQVTMPQLGESVVEGTVDRWLVAEGQAVSEYDPLLQVTTDKVDTEIPAPASGILLKIYVPEGQTVAKGTLLALIGQPGEEAQGDTPGQPPAQDVHSPAPVPMAEQRGPEPATDEVSPPVTPVAQRMAVEHGVDLAQVTGSGPGGRITKEDVEAYLAQAGDKATAPPRSAPAATGVGEPGQRRSLGFISPAVARLAAELDVDLNQVAGTGEGGRITKKDVQSFAEDRGRPAAPARAPAPDGGDEEVPVWEQPGSGDLFKPTEPSAPERPTEPVPARAAQPQAGTPAPPVRPLASPAGSETRPLSAMRRSIARHMVMSKETSAHVVTVMEADMTRVIQARERLRPEFEQQGTRLTFTPFFVQAIIAGLKAVPEANSSFQEDSLLVHRHIHIGVAVAMADGLIVPVVRDADEKSLLGLALAVNDLAERARSKQLTADDVQGGTFTLTNHGTAGSLFATPIINQPQAGILGVGAIQKRPVVISRGSPILPDAEDFIAIRPMAYLSFSFDHRILDGAGADGFLGQVKRFLETYVI
jgi:pyruvate/2-oxoglutarate dehydrogenase complex dihydrolipoamide acyltransferase (E2) component